MDDRERFDFIRWANRLTYQTATGRRAPHRCKDGFCGADDCVRCKPNSQDVRREVPYDDSVEPMGHEH